ncbi:MAG: glycine zipper 2TM domain-containing protein [Gammaproteobacteria bacterium]|nr:glycine zipper 2TM domain-containing protein [Gammaproteobacteria bacterium]MBT8109339.1 glycine zipper 2TM domain-containing protein [Gammaproteobacteria bacterium]NNL44041.1 glycine zipper 2TM domain-containing protein [Woeseiaceae bacterium]
MIKKVTMSLLVAIFLLTTGLMAGCETTSHAQQGEVIGGVLGGVLGAQIGEGRGRTAAIIVGTIAGAMIGRQIGENMDDTDRMQTAMVLNDARTGESTTWINPDNGNRYTVTPTQTFEQGDGPCREFRLDARVGDQADQEVYGTACLQADGSWLVR